MAWIDKLVAQARSLPTADERIKAYFSLGRRAQGLPGVNALRERIAFLKTRATRDEPVPRWKQSSHDDVLAGLCEDAVRAGGLDRAEWYSAWSGLRRVRRVEDEAKREREARAAREARLEARRAKLAGLYRDAIRKRGGEVTIQGRYGEERVEIVDRAQNLCVLRAEGWRDYKSDGCRWVALSYLCGRDDTGHWAVRVAGTIRSVREALAFIEPAAVRQARKAGRRVLRQGDVYVVEVLPRHDRRGAAVDGRHVWVGHTLTHPEHAPLAVDFPARCYLQHAYEMRRIGRRGRAD